MASHPSHPSADRIPETTDLLQKMTLDSQPKDAESADANKKPSANQLGASDSTNGQVRPYELSTTPVLPEFVDPNMCYMPNGYPSTAYFYGAYDGNEWNDYTNMLSAEGVEMQAGTYGYGYAPYGPYSPAASPVPRIEGQLYGAQHYQYPTSYFQPMNANSGSYTSKASSTQPDANKPTAADQKPVSVENSSRSSISTANGGGSKVNNGFSTSNPAYGNSSHASNGSATGNINTSIFPASSYYESKSVFDGVRALWQDNPASDGQPKPELNASVTSNKNGPSVNQSLRPNTSYMGLQQTRPMSGMGTAQGFMNNLYPNKLYGHYGNAYRPGMGYGSYNTYDSRAHGHGWIAADGKYRPRGRGYGFYGYSNESADGLNELNRGPRAKGTKNVKEPTPVTLAVKGQALPTVSKTADEEKDGSSLATNVQQYNQPDFPVEYKNAKFFIIKSYSEDDVHKSIKYNMWASTPNGNKKLDAAYREAQEISGGCPVFLFFSVNASGQFVGVAEMVGPVDFDKTLDYWQQDKWNGCFPLKWQVVKDVPNMLLKHIILENNDNKPVTNSRDTQEVKLEQGLQMLKIFKDHVSRTSIVDDFGFYEARQKAIQEKKAKQQQFQKQVWEGKLAAEAKKDGANEDVKLPESAPDVAVKEPQTHVTVP
uniref:YTH domain-containing family protein n=1 Tax=Kalanchoe fedtschenkoi TaxID=63787 RepID=A0A7N0V774_KALFE